MRWLSRFVLILWGVVFAGLLLELGIRWAGHVDQDGQFSFLRWELPPYALPVQALNQALARYQQVKDALRWQYDPAVGWRFRPSHHDELYTINAAGLRADREFDVAPAPDVLRIALFGDSMTAGDEIGYADTWGVQLERWLNDHAIAAEVLNFGVDGYSMGQAYLLWRAIGKAYQPDIVIFGFQPENMYRNLNMLPLYLAGDETPFSRPGFTIEKNTLKILNYPALSPEAIVALMPDFHASPLAPYELFYPQTSLPDWVLPSRLLTWLGVLLQAPVAEAQYEPLALTHFVENSIFTNTAAAITQAFADDVNQTGATFVVLHLPHSGVIHTTLRGEALPYQFLLDQFEQRYAFIDAADVFGVWRDDDWMPGYHYAPSAAARIARLVAEAIAKN